MSAFENQNYHVFDAMSTEELENLLLMDSYSTEDSPNDMDVILYIMEVLAKRKQKGSSNHFQAQAQEKLAEFKGLYLPDNDGVSLYQFEEEGSTSSRKTQSAPSRKQGPKHVSLVVRRIGLVAAVVAAIFGLMITVQAAGVNVFGAIARWTDETFHFSVQENGEGAAWYSGYQDDLDAAGLREGLMPTWIPEGYTLEDVQG